MMRRRLSRAGWTLAALALTVAGSQHSSAQTMSSAGVREAAQQAMEEYQRQQEALAAVAADKAGFVDGIAARWQSRSGDSGGELRRTLLSLSPDRLVAAQAAESPNALREAVNGKGGTAPTIIGDDASDLVFFPVTPCRIIDTRLAGGQLAAGVPRDFDSQGPFDGQGGSDTDCGLPSSDTAALALTIVAVNPAGAGNLRAWPAGLPVPNAAVLNYGLPGSGLNIANTTILPLAQDVFNPNEFTMRADVSATHVVADVVGYFWSPNGTALECTTVSQDGTFANGVSWLFTSGTCPAGYTATGGGINYHTGVLGNTNPIFQSSQDGTNQAWRCRGYNQTGLSVTVNCSVRCCRIPGR